MTEVTLRLCEEQRGEFDEPAWWFTHHGKPKILRQTSVSFFVESLEDVVGSFDITQCISYTIKGTR